MAEADRNSDEYHYASIRCAFVRQHLGGIPAVDSHMFVVALHGLLANGHTEHDVYESALRIMRDVINGRS